MRNDVAGELSSLGLAGDAGRVAVGSALTVRIVDRDDRVTGVPVAGEIADVLLRQRYGAGEQGAFACSIGFVVKEEKRLVLADGAADRAAELVLNEWGLTRAAFVGEDGAARPLAVIPSVARTAASPSGFARRIFLRIFTFL